MTTKKLYKVLAGISMSLVVIIVAFIVNRYQNPSFDFITYIAGISSLFVAILTVLYVLTTTKQLDMMDRQLVQMERESKLKNQPYLFFDEMKMIIEEPRFFYTPPTDEYNFFSRYYIEGVIDNLTNEPAIGIVVFGKITISENEKEEKLLGFESEIEALRGFGRTSERELSIMISSDTKGIVFERLRRLNTSGQLKISTRILYKSISGGYYLQNNIYRVSSSKENSEEDVEKKETIKEWHTVISMFWTKYAEELIYLKRLRKSESDTWREKFNEIKTEISNSIRTNPIELKLIPIVRASSVEPISEEKYQEEFLSENYSVELIKQIVTDQKK